MPRMHQEHIVFTDALEDCHKVMLTFPSKEDVGAYLIRTCPWVDFGPSSYVLSLLLGDSTALMQEVRTALLGAAKASIETTR